MAQQARTSKPADMYDSKAFSGAIDSLLGHGCRLSSNHVRAHGMIVVGGQRRGGPHVLLFGRPWKNIPSEASSTLLSITERLLDEHTRDKAADELRSLSSRKHAGKPIIEWEHAFFASCSISHQFLQHGHTGRGCSLDPLSSVRALVQRGLLPPEQEAAALRALEEAESQDNQRAEEAAARHLEEARAAERVAVQRRSVVSFPCSMAKVQSDGAKQIQLGNAQPSTCLQKCLEQLFNALKARDVGEH
eukprot:176786-Pelagomonas_calceolata.AAC.1